MSRNTGLYLVLIVMGAGWGLTQPLSKIAVDGGLRQFGLVFWQVTLSGILLGLLLLIRRRRFPLGWAQLRACLIIGLIGTLLPNAASYTALEYLPSGLISILLSLIPMMAFPVALLMGNEVFEKRRLWGLALGLVGVLLITLPEASLPKPGLAIFIPLALIAPAFYAFEGNYVARWGTAGLDPIQLLFGASVLCALMAAPLAISQGQWINLAAPWSRAEVAMILSSLIHGAVYTSYVWMVGRAGPIFAVQVSYLVTGFGVVLAMWLLGERYSLWVWIAFAVLLVGLFFVQPRAQDSD